MPRVSLFFFATYLMAQSPIGIGPSGLVQSLVLGPASHTYGDTQFATGWLSSAAALPVPSGLPVIITGNDGNANINVWQLDTLDWTGSNVHATLINSMSSFGGASITNVPAGWWSYCSQLSLTNPPTSEGGQGCSWKSRGFVVIGGCLYLPVARQITSGTSSDHDATILKSCDAGQTWVNPYTASVAGTPRADGDAPPPCAASPCSSDPVYTGAMMWFFPVTGSIITSIYNWSFVTYGQDGNLPTMPSSISGGLLDPALYACATLNDGSLGCAPNASILDKTTWRYYAGRITQGDIPDPNNIANWTYLFDVRSSTSITPAIGSQTFTVTSGLTGLSAGTRVYIHSLASAKNMSGLVSAYSGTNLTVNVDSFTGSGAATDWDITPRTFVIEPGYTTGGVDYTRPSGYLSAPVWVKEFQSYLMTGWFARVGGTTYTTGFVSAPSLAGPWTTVYISPTALPYGFPAISLGLHYTVVSSNPPIIRLTQVGNGTVSYTWNFSQWEFVQGRQPYGIGENPAYTDIGLEKLNAGWVFGSGETPGTFSRKGLIWAFDFMDHGGNTSSRYPYFHDVANNSAVLYPCVTSTYATCGYPSGGVVYNADSVSTQAGYSARFESRLGDVSPGGATPANLNAPSVFQGNGTFSVVSVIRKDDTSHNGPYWVTGTDGASTSVGLYGEGGANTGKLAIEWGSWSQARYRFMSTFIPTTSSWYFVASTVKANGSLPIVHMWVGVGSVLVDELAGVSRDTNGSPSTPTPAVTTAPFFVGQAPDQPYGQEESIASLMIYDHELSSWEVQNLYQNMKVQLVKRGITVQ